jgi:hypothetical protein
MSGDLLYVYTVLLAASPALDRLRQEAVPGLDGRPVWALVEGELAAVVGGVPSAEFEEAPLNEHLRDLAWLAPRAAQHQAVNASLLEWGDALLPLSFGTVYRRPDGVLRMLRDGARDFASRLEAVRGRTEWVATLQRDAAAATAALETLSPAVRALQAEAAASAPGRAYLLRRRLADLRRDELRALDARVAGEVETQLGAWVERSVAEPMAEGAAAGATQARLSLLVTREREGALLDAAARVNATWRPRGYRLELSGPWPPYRFAGAREGASSGAA